MPDNIIYLQNTPGTYGSIRIPDLATLSNRVIHRAELQVEQLYDISDSLFKSPDFLYIDAVDPSITTNPKLYRSIPFDLHYGSNSALDFDRFSQLSTGFRQPVSPREAM